MHRLKELRIKNQIEQKELAKAIGFSQQTISLYENYHREPNIETLKLLANYFNVSIDYLLGETEIDMRYNEENDYLNSLKANLSENGYDLSNRSAEDLIKIINKALELSEEIKKETR